MRRAVPLLVIWVIAAALPAAAIEPSSVIEPPRDSYRHSAFSGDHAVFGYYTANSEVEGRLAGFVEVYTDSGTGWSLAATLQPDGLGRWMFFGYDMAIQGQTLVVSAPGDSWNRAYPGKVRIFTGAGSDWAVVDTLMSPDAAPDDQFGISVGLDGDVLAVGTLGIDSTNMAYVYERTAGVWGLSASLAPKEGDTDFGRAVEVSGDTIVVGASEAIYVFVKGAAGWECQKRITTPATGWRDLNLSGDTLAFEDDEAGAVRVYQRSGITWSNAQKITRPPDVAAGSSNFPDDIALFGDTMVVSDERDRYEIGVVNTYGQIGGTWVRTDVFEMQHPTEMAFADTGELMVGHGASYSSPSGPYYVFAPLPAVECHGETPTIVGTDGDDVLVGTLGRDVIHGFDGDDIIEGRGGDDLLCGGPGTDTVSFESARRVKADLTAGYATGHHGDDLLYGFENIIGTKGKDVLIGDEGRNYLYGMGNNDVLRGMEGNDVIDGGDGIDATSYLWAADGVTVDLVNAKSSGPDGVDALIDIEGAFGSSFDDILTGDDGPNVLRGLAGNDILEGGPGDDVLRGGAGPKDQIVYKDAPAGVFVDLREGIVTGGDGTDKLSGVENVAGSDFRDVLIGNAKNNILLGRDGSDFLNGRSGNDTLMGGGHDNFYVPGPGDDTVRGDPPKVGSDDTVSYEYSEFGVVVDLGKGQATGQGTDKLVNINFVIGSRHDDVIDGEDDFRGNLFVPLAGDDVVRGAKNDQVSFAASKGPVTVHLGNRTATGEGSDRLYGVREIVGSRYDDTITGTIYDDALWGLEGDDTLRGSSGDDYLDGREGFDRLEGGYGSDYCRDGESHSSCEYTASSDARTAEETRAAMARILEFMELDALYR